MFKLSKVAKILLIASSLWYFGEGLFGPLFAVFAEKVGGDLLDITWAWSAYLVVVGIMYVVVGKSLQKSPYREEVMVFGYALNTIFTFCFLAVHSPLSLFLVQVGTGVAESLSTPTWDALFANTLEEKDDTFLWSIANGHTHFITGIAVAIGGLITYYLSYETLFITMGIIQALATMVQFQIVWLKRKHLKQA